MDLLDRITPAAEDLLARVDAALRVQGAPADHPIWPQLRRLGATPAQALAFFTTVDPVGLRATGAAMQSQAREYALIQIPVRVAWDGAGGESYTRLARTLAAHLDAPTDPDGQVRSMTGRLAATASYVEDVADWSASARHGMAHALAEAITSAQAVTVRSCAALTDDAGPLPAGVVTAAADIGAHVLAVASAALADGYDLLSRWRGRLDELLYQPPGMGDSYLFDATVHLQL